MADGDLATAISLGEQLVAWAPQEEQSVHRLTLARAYLGEGRNAEGAQSLIIAFEQAQDNAQRTEVLGVLGNLYESLGQWQAAIEVYQRYLSLDGEAAGYVRFHVAMAHQALGEDARAQEELLAIDLASLPASKQAQVLQELAEARRRLLDIDGALAAYNQILAFAQNRTYRAQIETQVAQTLLEGVRVTEAYPAYERILRDYAGTQAAAQALHALDEAKKIKLDDLARAKVHYDAGQYPAAVEALLRYLKQQRPANKAEAQYYLAQAFAKQRDFTRAFDAYDEALETVGKASKAEQERLLPLLGQIWMAKGLAVARHGGDAASIYYEFWRQYPTHTLAAEALYQAASWAETEIGWATAGGYYRTFRQLYPQDARAPEALFRQGLAAYATGEPGAAVVLWSQLLVELPESATSNRARTLTWLGKAAHSLGDDVAARGLWAQANELAPDLYYGLRADDLAHGIAPQIALSPARQAPSPDLADADWEDIRQWVGTWYTATLPLTDTVRIQGLERRGRMLRRIGWYDDADAAYREASQLLNEHPTGLADLAWRCTEELVYPYAIAAAARLINLGRAAGADAVPAALWRVAYPTHYGHLVEAEAERYGFDPLLFMALMRQESRFDARAVSYAGATGLTQVMPATGEWIAGRINDAAYRHSLLMRPVVSVGYGTWYLNMLLQQYHGDWVAALVGYNAGPGNLQRWTNGQPIGDHDLFYEMIPNQQAQDYVRLIYQQYRIYQRVYSGADDRSLRGEASP
jgi:soluble lytic murein transglycosylase